MPLSLPSFYCIAVRLSNRTFNFSANVRIKECVTVFFLEKYHQDRTCITDCTLHNVEKGTHELSYWNELKQRLKLFLWIKALTCSLFFYVVN